MRAIPSFTSRTVHEHRGRSNMSIRDGDLYSYNRLIARYYWFGLVVLNSDLVPSCTTRRHTWHVSGICGRQHIKADPESLHGSVLLLRDRVKKALRKFAKGGYHKRNMGNYYHWFEACLVELANFTRAAGLPPFETDPLTWGFWCLDYAGRVKLGRYLGKVDVYRVLSAMGNE